jgi:hypothetical protein
LRCRLKIVTVSGSATSADNQTLCRVNKQTVTFEVPDAASVQAAGITQFGGKVVIVPGEAWPQ